MAVQSIPLTKEDKQKKNIRLIRERAENDLEFFIHTVHPQTMLGGVHRELIHWWERSDAKTHQLTLLPRDHQKSRMIAYRVAQAITKNPAIRILYISSTANLATKQLKFIKDILTSDRYKIYWPEMVHEDEGKREKWTEYEFSVDHPLRKKEAVRDPTVFTAGLTTGIVGLHCDIAVLDDVVVRDNSYTEEGREKTESQYSYLASIEAADAKEWVVGTRYHPRDLYNKLMSMTVDQYDEDGELKGTEHLYEIFERQVEDRGDGSGQFLWPKQQRYDGKWFGFDRDILAKKRAQYIDAVQFRAQYYNDPNDTASAGIKREYFQYYEPKFLNRYNGKWFFRGKPLNVVASIDFAYSLQRKADYTSICVVGTDANSNYYVLDVERFKADTIKEYFDKLLRLHTKWGFKKLRAEVNAAQQVIVNDLKHNYIQKNGLSISIDEYRPSRIEGTKEERIQAILQARYANLQIWHYAGGNCQTLEEELVLSNPPHDDCKDALAAAIDISIPPQGHGNRMFSTKEPNRYEGMIHPRFGGVI